MPVQHLQPAPATTAEPEPTLAVRDLHMTIDEAVWAATVGGAAALQRPELGRLSPGSPADAVVLDAPSYTHLVYRPGMQLVAGTLLGGLPSSELRLMSATR